MLDGNYKYMQVVNLIFIMFYRRKNRDDIFVFYDIKQLFFYLILKRGSFIKNGIWEIECCNYVNYFKRILDLSIIVMLKKVKCERGSFIILY